MVARATEGATIVVIVEVFDLLDREERLLLTVQEADDWVARFDAVTSLELVAGLVAFVTLMAWLSRSVDNTPALGGGIARRGHAELKGR